MGKPREETIYFDQDHSWRYEIEDFYECIAGQRDRPVGDLQDALRVMRLIERIYQAGQA